MSAAAVNQKLRLARGEHGSIVVTAAWCGQCRREVMPRDDGTCGWCNAKIVDEDALPAKRLLALLADEPVATYTAETEPGPVEPAPPVSETSPKGGDRASATVRRGRGGRRRVEYDLGEIREQLLAFHAEQGREPTFADIKTFGSALPPALAAIEWRDVALELGWADPTAPKRGRRRRSSSGAPVVPISIDATAPASPETVPQRSPQAATLDEFTVDDLWAVYEAVSDTQLRAKLRRAIELTLTTRAA